MKYILFLILFNPVHLFAQASKTDEYAGKEQMNDIVFKDMNRFYEKWKPITTRYRKDTHEMRFTYANDLAWQSLKAGTTDYPDGAIFAKIGFITNEDPAFVSSEVPSGTKRYQFMVRDKKKYAATGGWGYALFNANGVTMPGNPATNALACAACHKLVTNKGQVFSEFLQFEPFQKNLPPSPPVKKVILPPETKITFKVVDRSALPERVQDLLFAKVEKVRQVNGELAKHLFEGTLQEIQPLLLKEAFNSHLPALLLSSDGKMFSLVQSAMISSNCSAGESRLATYMTINIPALRNTGEEENISYIKASKLCYKPTKI